jgi:hypothetical protein
MNSTRTVGRLVGGLLLFHLVAGLMLPYILLKPAIAEPGFLVNAARNPGSVRAPMLLFILSAAVVMATSIAAYPVLRQRSHRWALAVLALAIANVPLQMVESGMLLAMLSFSQQYVSAGGADGGTLPVVASAIGALRRGVHYLQLITVVSWIFVLFAALRRASLIPIGLAAAGMATCALQIFGVPLQALLGYPLLTYLAMPLAPAYFGLALWLLVKGFGDGFGEGFGKGSGDGSGEDGRRSAATS